MREQGKSKEFTILNPRSDERNDPFFWEILVITLLSTCHGLTKTKTNFLTEDRVQFLWEMDKLNMLADCLNFAFWSAFEEKWWLFHYGNDIEDFLSMCNYKNSRACNYISIYTENSSNLFFFFYFHHDLISCFDVYSCYLTEQKYNQNSFSGCPCFELNIKSKSKLFPGGYSQRAQHKRKLPAWRWWKRWV